MARIREAHIGEDGEIRIARQGGGGWRVVLALALIVGGVWFFDESYGGPRNSAAYEQSDAVSN